MDRLRFRAISCKPTADITSDRGGVGACNPQAISCRVLFPTRTFKPSNFPTFNLKTFKLSNLLPGSAAFSFTISPDKGDFCNMNKTSKSLNAFRTLTLFTLGALLIEFILGMYTALFVEFPDTLADGNAWAWSQGSPVVQAHVLVGTLLVLLVLATVVLGFVARNRNAIISSIAGLVLVAVAYVSGSIFLANIANDNYSFYMALGFMGSVVAYFAAFYFTRPARQS
jgi:hypothetical protein